MPTNSKIINNDIEEIIEQDLPWSELKGMNFLVTGASGMIPSYVIYTLLALNNQFGLDISITAMVRNRKKAESILGGILDRPDITLLVQDVCIPYKTNERIDYIIHGGSAAKPSEHKTTPVETVKANLLGTLNLLELAIAKKTKAFMFMSSSEVYGTVDDNINKIKETDYGYIDILNPRSCYSEGKRAAETICASYINQYNIECKIPRFAHIYGPGLALDDGRVQVDFASRIIKSQNIIMNSDGSNIRAYTYVSDAVCGLFYILLNGHDMAYNVANSDSIISIRQLAEAFINSRPEKKLSLKINISNDNNDMYNPAKFIALDDSKLKALGWEPKVDINSGIDRMLSYYEQLM